VLYVVQELAECKEARETAQQVLRMLPMDRDAHNHGHRAWMMHIACFQAAE
jgi:hypothetical protein